MSQDTDSRLELLERKLCGDPCFSDEEKAIIRDMIRIFRGWRFIAKVLRGTTVVVGALVAFIAAVKSLAGEVSNIWPF